MRWHRVVVAAAVAGLCVGTATAGGTESDGEGVAVKIIDFQAGAATWPSIDDVVMGGRSASDMVLEDGVAVFRGTLSLENNGGFASVRSLPADHDLSAYAGLVVRVRGDGRRYRLRLRTSSTFDGVSYEAPLDPGAGTWQEISVPFSDFEPVFRGRRVAGHPPLDPARVKTFGLLIADRQAGPFRLEIGWLMGRRELR